MDSIVQYGQEVELKGEIDTLPYWINLYFGIQVQGRSKNTIKAKRYDINIFLSFFYEVLRSYCIDLWTPSVSRSLQAYLLNMKESGNKVYKPSSVSRIMSL